MSSSGWHGHSGREGASPGTHSSSTIASPPRLDGTWEDEPLRHLTTYAPGDNRVDITIEDVPALSLWWVTRSEWEGLLDVSGLETEALYGWFDRRPFDDASREFVWIARKPA